MGGISIFLTSTNIQDIFYFKDRGREKNIRTLFSYFYTLCTKFLELLKPLKEKILHFIHRHCVRRQFSSLSRNPFSYQRNGSEPDVSLMNGDKIKRPEKRRFDRGWNSQGTCKEPWSFEVNKKSVVGGRRRTSRSNMHPTILHGSSLAWDLL